MNVYTHFVFSSYKFDMINKTLSLNYMFDDKLSFTESYRFNFAFDPRLNLKALDRAFQNLFFLAGVSYFKAYPTNSVVVKTGKIDQQTADFLNTTYQKGLGEYFYLNKLDPKTPIKFPVNIKNVAVTYAAGEGLLIGVGGGKDSLVSIEMLRSQPKVATWSLNHRTQLEPLVNRSNLPHFWVERTIDKTLLDLNKKDALNGHIPISAIIGCVGTIVSILTGYQDHVVSNEQSANEPTLHYEGVAINHQYSKSSDYEQAYQKLLKHHFGASQRYYSFLRPLSELRIAELFTTVAFEKYKKEFSSCNRAFVLSSDSMSWCGVCSKCAFTFLMLTPFIAREKLEKLWGKNLLLDPKLERTYKQLLGTEGDKPLDCVGEIKESRTAMQLAQAIYPQLVKYHFDVPASYDFRALFPHDMPDDIYQVLLSAVH